MSTPHNTRRTRRRRQSRRLPWSILLPGRQEIEHRRRRRFRAPALHEDLLQIMLGDPVDPVLSEDWQSASLASLESARRALFGGVSPPNDIAR
jgi:hypothetical protein